MKMPKLSHVANLDSAYYNLLWVGVENVKQTRQESDIPRPLYSALYSILSEKLRIKITCYNDIRLACHHLHYSRYLIDSIRSF